MKLKINGEIREIDADTVEKLLSSFGLSARLVVVDVNGQIVNRKDFSTTHLNANDVVEVLQMMAGG